MGKIPAVSGSYDEHIPVSSLLSENEILAAGFTSNYYGIIVYQEGWPWLEVYQADGDVLTRYDLSIDESEDLYSRYLPFLEDSFPDMTLGSPDSFKCLSGKLFPMLKEDIEWESILLKNSLIGRLQAWWHSLVGDRRGIWNRNTQ